MELIKLHEQYLVINGDTWKYFKTYSKACQYVLEQSKVKHFHLKLVVGK